MYYADIVKQIMNRYKTSHTEAVMNRRLDVRVLENILYKPKLPPFKHADFLRVDQDKVMQIMRYFILNNQARRDGVLYTVDMYLRLLEKRLNDEPNQASSEDMKNFTKNLGNLLKEKTGTTYSLRGFYLLALLKFCADPAHRDLFPERQTWIRNMSAVDARNLFRDLEYEIEKREKGVDVRSLKDLINESVQTEENPEGEAEETAEERIQALEFQLQTTKSTLQFIQRSLDDMVQNVAQKSVEAKDEAIADFFTQLNSERYGRLLDNALLVDQKLTELRKAKYRFPVEIMAIPMIIKNFMAFIKGIGFEPIRLMNEEFEASADDLTYVVYEGTPFQDGERKLVQVRCPGWKRGGVIISQPVVKEVVKEDM